MIMEDNNSCLMMNCSLYLPVSLSSIFDKGDLKDTGIENESHITLLYAQGKEIPRMNILKDIETILGGEKFDEFINIIKEENTDKVNKHFELGSFENDSDYVILKLKPESEIYDYLGLINKGLRIKYEVKSTFDSYIPHLSLVELQPGTAKKYVGSETLKLVLEKSYISFEDLVLSIGPSNTPVDRIRYNLTTFNAVDYYFYIENNRKENSELDAEE